MKLTVYKKRLITLALAGGLMLVVCAVQAQLSYDYLKAADSYFKKADYSSAFAYYEKFLQAKGGAGDEHDPYAITSAKKKAAVSSKQQAVYQLAESYRLLTVYDKAAPLYQQITAEHAAEFPLAYYHYATCLRALARYSEAEKAINSFIGSYKENDSYSANAQRELLNLRFIQQQLQKGDSAQYAISKISKGKEGASYAPVWAGDNTLLFTATWTEGGKGHTNHLFKATYNNGELSNVSRAGLPASDLHEGAAVLSADGNTMYLTRWQVKGGKKSAAIYVSRKTNNGTHTEWQAPVALSEVVNTTGYNSQQPFLMPGGKQLLYVSDKPGGQGGLDIWVAELNSDGNPVKTTNPGMGINTQFNEQAPYYHAASRTLVFASEGRVGMGGYDLFYSKGTVGNWDAPENFGYPVNSVKDDIYFASRGSSDNILEQVVLSSDRSAVCCLELLQLQKQQPVVAKVTPPVPDSAVVTKTEPEKPVVKEPLTKEPVETVTVLGNVFFELNKATVTRQSYPQLDSLAIQLQARANTIVEISGHTDDTGSDELNQQLSEERAANVVAYLVSKGVSKSRLTAKGYGATKPVAPNKNADGTDNPAGREKNRRTEMRIITIQ
ncbi:WD40-like Beta Propeller Repeat [Filimonas lacunae]|uniref:WD40-like Beta Propeller Repeat n=1 Tax=Filimonas lacunae TaxID=477680 RepID=A0A173MPA6_9BACT|nr:OmpA family protein [Filimonas lacunae]BAV09307.1 outer membrane lipoprotein omp16 precursor [Filimonas lacunae]SIS70873.1 WD40-like Beta Propeller Repeat [Filimonas lacunae]